MKLIDGEKLIADLRRYGHETISVDGLEGLIDVIEERTETHSVCLDTISRQEAITQLSHNKNKGDDEWKLAVGYDILTIWKLPSAQPRIKGKWNWCGNHHLCSECDEWALTRWDEDGCDEMDILTDFCPNCGADMRGEQE